ncbi:VWA domain-containing protein [Acuticoccus sediminis]|uniref:VWA domain-containing protein n=1 Tax=Acuticoccus sediminis TaxID=2184697 RepID=A0A8B2P2G4_9HYPH|nr:VWA domain-containing protein [Acuticoccus sediminis]RAI04336.1 VWA domain-containing protein [Acuticoccus sediminis]
MTDLGAIVDAFHFIRPWVLLLVPVIALLWWSARRAHVRRDVPAEGIAPHLRAALTVGAHGRRRLEPIDGVAVVLLLVSVGAAGPTWSRVPDPFAAQSAPMVVALKVTPSMEATDVAPSRLERGKQKIRDLLELRAGARTALVAYAGTAHVVVPMTEDPGVMVPYLEGLSPEVMPQEGDRAADALAAAEGLLGGEDGPGGIVFVADALDPADVAALDAAASAVAVLAMLPAGTNDRGLDALAAPVVPVTPDGSDVRRVEHTLNAAYRQALLEDGAQPWEDQGHWLAIPAALLGLFWFRRGFTMRWALVLALAAAIAPVRPAEAGVVDWFLTPDQQGQRAFNSRQYRRAAELFVDPLWRGYALYRDGQYDEAISVLSRVETAEAAFITGMAALKSRHYRDGVRAFETVLARDPDYPGAAENLATAKDIVAYVEHMQETSDTGEDRGIGADEVRYDNESGRGVDTEIEAPEEGASGLLTTDQWMATVDTRTGDFLRQRFALEARQ